MRGGISLGRTAGVGLSLTVLCALALGATAWAGSPNIVAIDDNYQALNYEIAEGASATFDNDGNNAHTVTADDQGPDGKPLFRTGNIPGGEGPVAVPGTEYLSSGQYPFHCSIHPEMQANLFVFDSPAGPVPRPEISLKVKSKKLEKVVKSGKLKVRVTAADPTPADVTLSAKKGTKGITKRASVDVPGGGAKTAKLKLKKSAVEKLAELEKAKVKVTAEVDFGSPAKASKKLK